ncbi:ribonuclease H1 [Aplysia californica]|uniref:Ribonuclease H1 n=1 Tax=Aplysia californica TaxID=6500 RepID=A0ABM0JQP3_APLCA|nr:ribonuclease H1 [Aplysia californica]
MQRFLHAVLSRSIRSTCVMPKETSWYYAVKRGRKPGVYHSWPECHEQVKGFSNPVFKKFSSSEDALEFVHNSKGFTPCTSSGPPVTVGQLRPAISTTMTRQDSSSSQDQDLQEIKRTLQIVQGKLESVVSELAQLSSTVNQIESVVFHAPGSKRAFHTSASSNMGQQQKRPKFDTSEENFTGKPFPDADATHVYTDGGCFHNGQNGAKAGIGVFWKTGDPDNISERLTGRPTNNRAEIHAAIRAVQSAKKKGIENLILHTDSQFLINGITKWIKGWKKNGWALTTGKPVINREDFEELDEELKGINVKWMYVKGHSGHPGNEAVDALAKKGVRKPLPDADSQQDTIM